VVFGTYASYPAETPLSVDVRITDILPESNRRLYEVAPAPKSDTLLQHKHVAHTPEAESGKSTVVSVRTGLLDMDMQHYACQERFFK